MKYKFLITPGILAAVILSLLGTKQGTGGGGSSRWDPWWQKSPLEAFRDFLEGR